MRKLKDIDQVEGMTQADFFDLYFDQEPVVMINMISDWPAVKEWSPDYFKRKYGQKEVCIHYHDPNNKTHMESFLKNEMRDMTLAEYVDSLSSMGGAHALREEYEIFKMLPGLINDVNYFEPFSRKEGCMVDGFYKALWFGPKGYETGMHADHGQQLLFHIHGHKRILFFAPDQTEYLYEEKAETSELYESMTEDIATFYSDSVRWAAVNGLRPDYKTYPLFEQSQYYEGHLEPGHVLYLPHYWWHTVESKDVSISISAELDDDNFLKFPPEQN